MRVEILLVHFVRVQLLLLHRTGHLLLVRERLALLADEELADVGSFVEELVVDSFVRLNNGREVQQARCAVPAVKLKKTK